jgi:3-deoxy-D-manno-octulosonic-acid transferase
VPEEKIKLTGNMKFDSAVSLPDTQEACGLREGLGLGPLDKLFVCGSTHPGEEEIILSVYKGLRSEFPNLKLLVAPRHPERGRDIAKVVSGFGFRSVFVSALPFKCSVCVPPVVYILDVVGRLVSFYAIADIVFVGGSLIKKGGHNILEPASLEKPVLFGPYMFNFRDISDLFLANKAAILINNAEELKEKVRSFLLNPQAAQGLSKNARRLIAENAGATKRNLVLIKSILQS